jgi:hypothetical protein
MQAVVGLDWLMLRSRAVFPYGDLMIDRNTYDSAMGRVYNQRIVIRDGERRYDITRLNNVERKT